MLLTPFVADAEDEKTQTFTAAYKAAYNDLVPTQFAQTHTMPMYVIKAAAREGRNHS